MLLKFKEESGLLEISFPMMENIQYIKTLWFLWDIITIKTEKLIVHFLFVQVLQAILDILHSRFGRQMIAIHLSAVTKF